MDSFNQGPESSNRVDNRGEDVLEIRDNAVDNQGQLSPVGKPTAGDGQLDLLAHSFPQPDSGSSQAEGDELSPPDLSLITDISSVNRNFSLSWIDEIELSSFRNYETERFELRPGFNLVTGANAQGKTNLLEALYLLSTTRLLRGRRDGESIRDESDSMSVKGTLSETATELKITLERGGRKRAWLNGMSLPRAVDLIGRLPSVTISTADLELVRGDPSDRRLYLDLELSSLYPAYLRAFTVYRRALEQRNALLRQARESSVDRMQFEPWEEEIGKSGAEMRQLRSEHLDELGKAATEAHDRVGDGEVLSLALETADEATDAEALINALAANRHADTLRGGTSVGPHRDDLAIFVGGRDARYFASQGQQRTAVIAIKLAGLPIGQRIFGKAPLLLLDDMLSDLDATRRRRLTDLVVAEAGQALLTCTEAESAGEHILSVAHVFAVSEGKRVA